MIKNPLAVGLKCSEGNHLKNHNMSYLSSIVTASGASEPQWSAGVDCSSVKTDSNVAGSLRSLVSDREGTWVADQAPVTLTISGTKTK
jgi:hypothetical protein